MNTQRAIKRPLARHNIWSGIWKSRRIYFLILPGLLWYLIFAYIPIYGLTLAFKDYKANLGIFASPWVGLKNYEFVFRDPAFWKSVIRTLAINAGRVLFVFPFPILLALIINEIRMNKYKRVLQTIFTFPHFLSWVIISSIVTNFLSFNGLVNNIIEMAGGQEIGFLSDTRIFRPLVYFTDIWKTAGWSAIIYMAAISGIDMAQYEAAEIDGASRLQKIGHITLPSILPTIAVLFILKVGNIMNTGFMQLFNLRNPATSKAAEILDIYIYRITFEAAADFSFSTAVSLFKSVINLVLLFSADKISKAISGNGLFGK